MYVISQKTSLLMSDRENMYVLILTDKKKSGQLYYFLIVKLPACSTWCGKRGN